MKLGLLQSEPRKSLLAEQLAELRQEGVSEGRDDLIGLAYQVVTSNWHLLSLSAVLLFTVLHEGIAAKAPALCLFLYFLPLQADCSVVFWQGCFLFAAGSMAAKKLHAGGLLAMDSGWYLALVGGSDQCLVEFMLAMACILQVMVLKGQGCFADTRSSSAHLAHARLRQPGPLVTEPGSSWFVLSLCLQIACTVYIFMFYDHMVSDSVSVADMLELNRFSGGLVTALLLQVGVMLIDRLIVTTRQKLWLKWVLHVGCVVGVHLLVFGWVEWLRPARKANSFLRAFYLLYCGYLVASCAQLRDGYAPLDEVALAPFTLRERYLYVLFRSLPFLFELKCFGDWCVGRTALRMFDWIKFEDLQGRLFVAKCDAVWYKAKPLGSLTELWRKVVQGVGMLLVILLLIFGPMVLFSRLNPLAKDNPVTSAEVQVLLARGGNRYLLFKNSQVTDIHPAGDSDWRGQEWLARYGFSPADFEVVQLSPHSD
jgi:hypothetical protein